MNNASFNDWFSAAANDTAPWHWQAKLAEHKTCRNQLIRIPTGMGKTLGVLSAWAYHRVVNKNSDWPRRLVWCLPMRTLVEQTCDEARAILKNAGLEDEVSVNLLMGVARFFCDQIRAEPHRLTVEWRWRFWAEGGSSVGTIRQI